MSEQWLVVAGSDGTDSLFPASMGSASPVVFSGTRLEAEGWIAGRWIARLGDARRFHFPGDDVLFSLFVGPGRQLQLWPGDWHRHMPAEWMPILEAPSAAIRDWAERHPWRDALSPPIQQYFAAVDKGMASI